MAVISGADYLAIAEFYAAAYKGSVALEQEFYDAVEQLRCLDDVSVTLDLLGEFNTAYLLAQSRLGDTSGYLSAVQTLQQHVTSNSGGLTLVAWIAANVSGGRIPYAWSLLSKQAGFNIDAVINYSTEPSSSSTFDI